MAFVEEALRWLPAAVEESTPIRSAVRLIAGARDRASASSRDSSRRRGQKPSRILWADDNADMRDYVARMLSLAGFEVEAVADGRQRSRRRVPAIRPNSSSPT